MIFRFLGHCQICEAQQKLHNGTLVHHGYKRPGHGEIIGDCYGVHRPPYEVSCDALKTYLPLVQRSLENQQEYLERLETGRVTHLTEIRRREWHHETVDYFAGTTEPHMWRNMIQSRIWTTTTQVRQLQFEVTRIERRIADWNPGLIRTIEEEEDTQRAQRAARDADREARRAAKDAIEAAKKAKKDALQAKRDAILADFRERFTALAVDPEANRAEATRLALSLRLTKYSWFRAWDLKCDDAFIRLGFATREADGYVAYRYPLR